jgi:hypothetical protein
MYRRLFGCLGLLLAVVEVGHAAALGSAFTYQGALDVSDQPANGAYDFEIALYLATTDGVALGTSMHDNVDVDQGLFAVTLDFTQAPFSTSTQYYLELRVRDGASTGAYTTLLPRQPILATPYALHARSVDASAIVGAAAARPVFTLHSITLPGSSPVAGDSSITIGVDGLPVASIYDSSNGDLVALHCDDPSCTQRTMTVLDSAGIVGRGNSIIVTPNGLPAISYIDSTNGALKMARCTDVRCTAAALFVVDPSVGDSRRSVIMTGLSGTLGTADIVYRDEIQGDVQSATCGPTGSCTLATIDFTGNVGRALDAFRVGQRAFVAYGDETTGSLKLKQCFLNISNCTSSVAITVDAAAAAADIALMAPPDGRPLIAYVRGTELRTARCSDESCLSTAVGAAIGSSVPFGAVSGTVGADGLPVMAALSSDFGRALIYKCIDAACTTAFLGNSLGNSPGDLNARHGLTLGAHGNPFVIYRVVDRVRLWVCDTPECGQARRR